METKRKWRLTRMLHDKFSDLSIRLRIQLLYLVLLVFTVVVSSFLYQEVYFRIMLGRVNELSMETLSSIEQNINTMLENVNVYSKLIITNEDIRSALEEEDSVAISKIGSNLQNFMVTVPVISSVYIFDNSGRYYIADREQSKELVYGDVKTAPWYESALAKKGGYLLSLNCGGFIKDKNGNNFVSFIRTFNDVQSQKPLGVLIVNLSEEHFEAAYQVLMKNYDTSFMLLDEYNRNIVSFKGIEGFNMDLALKSISSERNTYIEKAGRKEYLVSHLLLQKQNWKIVNVVPMSELLNDSKFANVIALIVFIINMILLFAGSLLISGMITNPISKLLKTMEGIENGKFELADIKTGRDEIGKLTEGYNLMVTKIQNLIGRVVEEQKVKRMAELNALQAQIKPHFLYNTFDSVSFLALSGRSKEVYEVISALGNYYRTSLSKGSEIITVNQEINTVRNYLFIQKVRYGNLFTDSYDIDEEAGLSKIPKLILQPLVENALYHGIKPKGENGIIHVCVKKSGDYVELTVEDDGVGMDEAKLSGVTEGTIGGDAAGFGLRGTIERLRMFYNRTDICQVTSVAGQGTRVVIRIPTEVKRDEW